MVISTTVYMSLTWPHDADDDGQYTDDVKIISNDLCNDVSEIAKVQCIVLADLAGGENHPKLPIQQQKFIAYFFSMQYTG